MGRVAQLAFLLVQVACVPRYIPLRKEIFVQEAKAMTKSYMKQHMETDKLNKNAMT
ncbi:uncharacterized protein RAG0_01041 [Rhynchosporium agropyri]|uniref:Uncharacterized protein n=1 Tax=Rhynchosporium agropyri TaxID=914238 RepID=A0A1E1JZT0_9HELO|nr:uncharacterized protein RAG0_01041 [Rhynchosporium agropyri]